MFVLLMNHQLFDPSSSSLNVIDDQLVQIGIDVRIVDDELTTNALPCRIGVVFGNV